VLALLASGTLHCSRGGVGDSPDGASADLRVPRDATTGIHDLLSLPDLALRSPRAWGPPVPIQGTELNTKAEEAQPSMTRDMLRICFSSDRADPSAKGQSDIYCATRPRPDAPFDKPVNQVDINTTLVDWMPSLSFDGNEMIFMSNRAGGVGDQDLYRAVWDAARGRYIAPQILPNVNSKSWDGGPALSPDALTLYLDSSRDGYSGLYVASRMDRASDFGMATALPAFKMADGESAMAPDGTLLVFCSTGRNGDMGGADPFLLWGSEYQGGNFGTPFTLPIGGMPTHGCGPEVLADGSLMFHAGGRPDNVGMSDLYIAPPLWGVPIR
jgi:hypothetical protein